MWQTLAAWLTGRAIRLVWTFLSNLTKARADDPRLADFIKEQIIYLQAMSGMMSGKDKLFIVADRSLDYAHRLGVDIAYSTMLTLTAALFDEVVPNLAGMVKAWIAKKTKEMVL